MYSHNLYSEILIDIETDDGHLWPKHVVLILTLKNIHLLYITRVVLLTPLPPIHCATSRKFAGSIPDRVIAIFH